MKTWAKTVQRIRTYPSSNDESFVCKFIDKKGNGMDIQADHARQRLWAIVSVMGEEVLGFDIDDVGLHSIRSGGVMAMFLSGTSPIVIKKIGRWSSKAFLEYIREQVEDFTAGVLQKILLYEDSNNLKSLPARHIKNEKEINNEDGPISIPQSVTFTDLAMGEESTKKAQRWKRK